MSGAAIHPIAVRAVHDVHAAVPDLPVIGVGGYRLGRGRDRDVAGRSDRGAGGTATFADPRVCSGWLEELDEWCVRHGVGALTEIIGGVHGRGTRSGAIEVGDLARRRRSRRRPATGPPTVPVVRYGQVGLELYTSVGPDAVTSLSELGFDVFCDLKFHDIATTVNKSSRCLRLLGAKYLNLHAEGGVSMLRVGVEGLKRAADRRGDARTMRAPVTVLTSDTDASPHILGKRGQAALESDCAASCARRVTCARRSSTDLRLFAVVPGIRPAGAPRHEQARAATPSEALQRARIASSSDVPLPRPTTRFRPPNPWSPNSSVQPTDSTTRAR